MSGLLYKTGSCQTGAQWKLLIPSLPSAHFSPSVVAVFILYARSFFDWKRLVSGAFQAATHRDTSALLDFKNCRS